MTPLLGYKLGMTRVFDANGRAVPVTAIQVQDCFVTQVKTLEKDGYTAVQVGTGAKRHANKPETGHTKAIGQTPQHLVEFRLEDVTAFTVGQKLDLAEFAAGNRLKLVGMSKGKGFAGVIKRHNFSRGPETHGSDHHRAPGSIGSMFPQHVMKGKGMPGRMGYDQQTLRKVQVIDVLPGEQILLVKGPVPGIRGALVQISPM
ncbi:50S ribosomal protein L3 [soil metagenome]